jgi:hypothetical protein
MGNMEKPDPKIEIPAMSIRQPWIELILRGLKTIELRKWTTDYRGPLWLHAPMKIDDVDLPGIAEVPLFTGGYVGFAVLRTILVMDARRWEDWRAEHCDPGPYVPGQYGWVLCDVVRFRQPLPASGKLGLFQPTDQHRGILSDLLDQVRAT